MIKCFNVKKQPYTSQIFNHSVAHRDLFNINVLWWIFTHMSLKHHNTYILYIVISLYSTVFYYNTYGNNLICYWATWAFKDICKLWVYILLEWLQQNDVKNKHYAPATLIKVIVTMEKILSLVNSAIIYHITR